MYRRGGAPGIERRTVGGWLRARTLPFGRWRNVVKLKFGHPVKMAIQNL
jgi:hypothetical protein